MNDKPEEPQVQSGPPHRVSASRRGDSPIQGGSLRIFRVAGIDVLVHWSWLIVAYFRIKWRASSTDPGLATYSSTTWYAIEYVALFGIVLLHEFGHVLACRSVGGRANRIILWPLGGVALVQPPPRPGAFLWSLAAGPLVNVLLLGPTIGLSMLSQSLGWQQTSPDVARLIHALTTINAGLLIFNLLPIYPLDGGQILQSLLWFIIGRARSLLVATIIGLVAAGGVLIVSLLLSFLEPGFLWLSLVAGFALLFSFMGLRNAMAQLRVLNAPRRKNVACPVCRTSPPIGKFWRCPHCQAAFDVFVAGGTCPQCDETQPAVFCPRCGRRPLVSDWYPQVVAIPDEPPGPGAAVSDGPV
jgi:Zn-dependent protease